MRPLLSVRPLRLHWLILTVAFMTLLGPASAADPVKDLEYFLYQRPNFQDKAQLTAFQKNLAERVKAIQRPSDLRRALKLAMLRSTFDTPQPGGGPDEEFPAGKIYQNLRADLVKRLQTRLRDGLQAKDVPRRLAAVTFLAAMARDDSEQGIMTDEGRLAPNRFTSNMTADLLTVLANKEEEARVRAAAAEAVAIIDPGAEKTLAALKALLKPERDLVERRAAATALGRMIPLLAPLQGERQGRGPRGRAPEPFPGGQPSAPAPRPSRSEQSLANIVSAAGVGLADNKDATVRRLCLETIRQALQQINDAGSRLLATNVNTQTPAVIRLLADDDLAVRLAAYQVLESTAMARRQTPRVVFFLAADLPVVEDVQPPFSSLLDNILKAVPQLVQGLGDKEVRVRLAALYVLESLGADAALAVEAVARTLKNDKNGFVRWGAARALNNMAPLGSEKAVPALAGALTDTNKTIRLTAAQALGRYGPHAKEAVKPLTVAVGDAEPHVRMGAIKALVAIGPAARPASGAVVKALADQTPEVRASAAEALAHLGPLDDAVRKALSKALEDADSTVRQAASETLLEN